MARRGWSRPARWVVVGVLVGAAATFGLGEARSAPPGPEGAVPTSEAGVSESVSPRWAGYVVAHRAVAYTSATGTWVEPHVSCSVPRPASSLSAIWVGLGGYQAGSTILAQVGIDANCSPTGEPEYGAWFELLPDVAHAINGTVKAGDTMTATVSMAKSNLVELRIADHTRGWTATRMITWSLPDEATAEWIVEAPYSCLRFTCTAASLSDFGSVSIFDVSAVGNGIRGNLATKGWSPTSLRLAACGSGPSGGSRQPRSSTPTAAGAGATPSSYSADGSQFRIDWVSPIGAPKICRPNGPIVVGGTPTNW